MEGEPARVRHPLQESVTLAGARWVIPLAILLAIPTYIGTRHLFEPFSSWFDHVVLFLLSAEVCAAGVGIAGALVWASVSIYDRVGLRTTKRPQGTIAVTGRCCPESDLGDSRDTAIQRPMFCAACGRVALACVVAVLPGTIAGPVASAYICAVFLPNGGVGSWLRSWFLNLLSPDVLAAGPTAGCLLNEFTVVVMILIGFALPSKLFGGLWAARTVRRRVLGGEVK